MKITFFSFYNISISSLVCDTGGTDYGNHLYYPINNLCSELKKKGFEIVEPSQDFEIALFLDLDEKLFDMANSLDKKIKKILITIESPIYCPFVYQVNILCNHIWDSVLTYNRSFIADKLFYYDIPITGNIENLEFIYPDRKAKGVIVSSYKNDPRGFVPQRRDLFLKQLAQKHEIELYGAGWKKEKNIYGKVSNKIEVMKYHSFALIIENCKYEGYVTEKLGDAILAGLPSIYYGDYKNAERRFPGTFVILEDLNIESFIKAKKELFNKYDTIVENVEKSFLNSNKWIESFLENIYNALNIDELNDNIKR